jgi:hypothetical protein
MGLMSTSRTHPALRAPLPRGDLNYIYYLRFIDKLNYIFHKFLTYKTSCDHRVNDLELDSIFENLEDVVITIITL